MTPTTMTTTIPSFDYVITIPYYPNYFKVKFDYYSTFQIWNSSNSIQHSHQLNKQNVIKSE